MRACLPKFRGRAGGRRGSRSQAARFRGRTLGCAAFDDARALLDARRRCRHHRGADPSASRHRARPASRAAFTCWSRSRSRPSVEEGRAIIAAARRAGVTLMVGHVERFNPAVESIKEAIQRRGHPLDRHHPRRSVPAAHVECRRGHRSRGARHRPDPLVHRFRDRRNAAAALERGGRARGHRAAAVPHRLRRAGAHQHQLADAVQGAHRPRRDAQQICDRRPADAARSPNVSASSRTAAIRCGIFRSAMPSRCARSCSPSSSAIRDGRAARGDRRGGRGEPRSRHPLPRSAAPSSTAPQRKGPRRVAG